jgi:hypothetical protein
MRKKAIGILSFALAVTLVGNPVHAQTIPANPLVPKESGGTSKRSLGGGGDLGTATGATTDPSKRTVVVQYVAVTPVQDWTNIEGKTIQARLLAFSAPNPGEEGPVEVIREGKVRMLIPGKPKPVDYPLASLTRNHRDEVEQIAKAAAKGPPETETEKAEAGKKE